MSERDDSRALSRRHLLRLGLLSAAGLALPWRAEALGPSSKLVLALLDHGAGSNPRPTALRRMAWEVVKRTSIEADLESRILGAGAPELFFHPLVVLAGSEAFEGLSPEATGNLRRHLTYGGLLLVDATEASPAFDRSVRELVASVLPGRELQTVPRDHVLYKAFYLLDEPMGRALRKPYLEGVVLDDRLAVLYSHNDLLGAWARDDLGMWEHDVEPRQRELAFRLGVNIVMYAMCLDYKDDQVHLPFILKRRKS